MFKTSSVALVLASFFPLSASAQGEHAAMDHSGKSAGAASEECSDGMGMAMDMRVSDDPVIAAWQRINMDMHAGMSIAYSGDPDEDFIRGMIPHHMGAVDMAELVLEHGSDPQALALAEAIIAAQEQEIAMMKAWLAERAN